MACGRRQTAHVQLFYTICGASQLLLYDVPQLLMLLLLFFGNLECCKTFRLPALSTLATGPQQVAGRESFLMAIPGQFMQLHRPSKLRPV